MNMGRGGVMLKTNGSLPLNDPPRIRIGVEKLERSGAAVLVGKIVWSVRGEDSAYGVAFLEGDDESYEKLRQYREVSHSRELAEASGLRFVDLSPSMIEKRALTYITKDVGFSLNCIPLKLSGDRLMVAMAEPDDPRTIEKLRLLTQCKIVPVVATPSAIRNAFIHCWGVKYVPSKTDRLDGLSFGISTQKPDSRIVAVASDIPNLSGRCLAANFVAVLNRHEERAVLMDLDSGRREFSDGDGEVSVEEGKWMILALSLDKRPSCLDWAFRADETVLVVSPSHWDQGCLYLEAVFNRFLENQKQKARSSANDGIEPGVLEFLVVCAEISDMKQGFKTFNRIERRIHNELDMKEPGVDIRLLYLGGIVKDERNFGTAEKAGVPLAMLKPGSPASQCMTHIAQSLLSPTHARDPRIRLRGSFADKLSSLPGRCKNTLTEVSRSWVLLALILGFVSIALLPQSRSYFGSTIFKMLSIWSDRAVSTGEETLPAANSVYSLNRIFVQRSAIALAVENREPKEIRKRVSTRRGRVYCWVHVINGEGRELIVRWISNGKTLSETPLPIGSNDWRTWTYITPEPNMAGAVQVQILDEDGELLKTEAFEIIVEGEMQKGATRGGSLSRSEGPLLRHRPWQHRLEPSDSGRR